MSNVYLVKIAETRMEKKASLVGAAASNAIGHVGQNIMTKQLMKSKKVADTVGKHFFDGMQGKRRAGVSGTLDKMKDGVLAPEIGALKTGANNLGHKLKGQLDTMPKGQQMRTKVGLRALARGDFDKIRKYGLEDNAAIRSALKSAGIPASAFTKAIKSADKSKLEALQNTWKSKDNPLTSNIVAGLGNAKKGFKKTVGGSESMNAASGKMASGAAAISVVDPVTGAMNAAKAGLMSNKFDKIPGVSKAKKFMEKKVVTNPAAKGFKKGMKGEKADGLANKAHSVLGNAVGAELTATANRLARSISG